jgi:UDP-N-acetylmuramate--alanine ligase
VVPIIAGLKCKVVDYKKIDSSQFKLHVPGKHNVENAQAAFAVGKVVGVKASITITALNNFSGTWRRQEYKGKTKKGALIYDDYAHHPTEVAAAISAFKDLHPNKKISVVFQPHLYSRTKLLLNDFTRELSRADGVIITDIYSAREKKDPKISGKILAEEIKKKKNIATYIKSFKDIERKLKIWADDDDVIITMGAGDVYKVGEQIVST